MIEQLITDYLGSNRRLVVPEVGAFLKKDDAGIVFAPFLNKDDGVLAQLVRQGYGISQIEASTIVAQYAAAIKESIADKGFYLIENIGKLKNDANSIIFLDTKDLSADEAVIKTAPLKMPEPKREVAVEKPVQEVRFEVEDKKDEREEVITIKEKVKIEPEPVKNPAPAAVIPVERPAVKPVAKQPGRASKAVEEKTVSDKDVHSRPVQQAPVKKKVDWVFVVAVIVAVAAVAVMIYGYLSNDVPLIL